MKLNIDRGSKVLLELSIWIDDVIDMPLRWTIHDTEQRPNFDLTFLTHYEILALDIKTNQYKYLHNIMKDALPLPHHVNEEYIYWNKHQATSIIAYLLRHYHMINTKK